MFEGYYIDFSCLEVGPELSASTCLQRLIWSSHVYSGTSSLAPRVFLLTSSHRAGLSWRSRLGLFAYQNLPYHLVMDIVDTILKQLRGSPFLLGGGHPSHRTGRTGRLGRFFFHRKGLLEARLRHLPARHRTGCPARSDVNRGSGHSVAETESLQRERCRGCPFFVVGRTGCLCWQYEQPIRVGWLMASWQVPSFRPFRHFRRAPLGSGAIVFQSLNVWR